MWPAADRFFASLSAFGNAAALRENERQLSYRQLLQEVDQRSKQLLELGAQRVALALDNGIDWVLWDLAVLQAELVCVPLPGFFSSSQQAHVLDSAGIDCLIGEASPLYDALGFSPSSAGLQQTATGASQRTARRHLQDHLHLGHHRAAQRRVPGQRHATGRSAEPGTSQRQLRGRASSMRAAPWPRCWRTSPGSMPRCWPVHRLN